MEATSRFRKKIEKDESYQKCIANLGNKVQQIIRQNNAIGISLNSVFLRPCIGLKDVVHFEKQIIFESADARYRPIDLAFYQ